MTAMTKFIDSFHPFPAPRRITRWCRPNYQQQRCWCQERSALAMASGIFNGKARYVHETNPRQEILWIKIGGTAWHITTDREQPEEAHGLIRAMARQRVRSRERWATFARRCWRGPHAVAATSPGPSFIVYFHPSRRVDAYPKNSHPRAAHVPAGASRIRR